MPEEHDRRHNKGYDCWLNYGEYAKDGRASAFERYFSAVFLPSDGRVLKTAAMELLRAARGMFGLSARIYTGKPERPHIAVRVKPELSASLGPEGYAVTINEYGIDIAGTDQNGALYGVFELLRSIGCGRSPDECTARRRRGAELRIVEHWDNISGEIERGYAGKSVFFRDNEVISDLSRAGDYARLLASVGITAVCINNVNVHRTETLLVTERYLPDIARLAEVLRLYGIRLFMSVNFAAPAEIGGLPDADPLNPEVGRWWAETAALIYSHIPDFGGFIVKADSENRPGPVTYGRDHAQGANMLARALKPYGGLVIWRCFVYDCHLDWRDRSTDRAMAAYQHFFPLDGRFEDNAVLQIKNGPMDFQVREPVSPLFGALEKTNAAIEFQITQEYTGQQKHVCYLVPMWKKPSTLIRTQKDRARLF
jgi:alpha-glucuronidase